MKNMTGENVVFLSRSAPMSLTDFHREIKRYLNILEREYPLLLDEYNVLGEDKCIWPDQFRSIADLLQNISEPIQEFCDLLENPAWLPEFVVPHRYLLLMALQNTD